MFRDSKTSSVSAKMKDFFTFGLIQGENMSQLSKLKIMSGITHFRATCYCSSENDNRTDGDYGH